MSDYQPIVQKMRAIEKRERDERSALLKDHSAKFNAEREALRAECVESGVHVWKWMPGNGVLGPHFVTGEWPMWCPYCRTHRPFGWTERGEPDEAKARAPLAGDLINGSENSI